MFQEDGSYLKINTLTLAYTFDKKLASRLGVTSMRVYCTGNNLYTFTNYTGPDPENVTDLGRDNSAGYPSRRSYSIGLNVQF
ncbi:TonB dependent receptor [compost metagenome]